MAEKVTFIHAADLHLGAPLRGLRALSETWADRVGQAIPAAFDTLVEVALERQVDFCVFAGDIFDQAQPSYANYVRFAQGLARLADAGIPSYLCTGNHDPYTSWRNDLVDLPASCFMFSAEKPSFTVFERGGKPLVLLGGRGFFNQVFDARENITEGITRAAAEEVCGVQAPFAIGVAHTGLHLDPNKAPSNSSELLRAGMDYWALGHIHQPWQDNAEDPRIVFSGCIQGRDVRETGPRGCYVVTLEEGKPNVCEFVPLAQVVWQLLDIDVSACASVPEIQNEVMRTLFHVNGEARCDEMVERIRLVGTTPLHAALQKPGVLEDLRNEINAAHPSFFCDSLRDATVAPVDLKALEAEGLFPAVLLDIAEELADNEANLSAFLENEFFAKNISMPPINPGEGDRAQRMAALVEAARNRALDFLGQGVQ